MNPRRSRMIRKLVLKKDPNLLATIIRLKGEGTFKRMSGVGVFKCAKELWSQYGTKDKWGIERSLNNGTND